MLGRVRLEEFFDFVFEVEGVVGWAEAVNDLTVPIDEEFGKVPVNEALFLGGAGELGDGFHGELVFNALWFGVVGDGFF